MPSKNRPKPAPVALQFVDSQSAIVTKTHDVEAAREALLEYFRRDAYTDDEALELLQPYLEAEPVLTSGRWTWGGSYDGEPARVWKAVESGRGVTPAVMWDID